LKNKASVRDDDDGLQVLGWAFRGISVKKLADHRSIIALLGEAGVPLNLHAIVVLGDVNRVRKLLRDQPALAKSIYREQDLLYWAVALNQKEMVAALLDAGVPIDGKNITPGGPSPPPGVSRMGGDSTALHKAVSDDDDKEEIVKLLIARKANVNACDERGATPLHNAVRWGGSTTISKLLLDAKADVNARDKNGATPLHEAGAPAVVKLLLNAKADVNAKDNKGQTPLHRATGNIDLVKLFLNAGADVNAKDGDGRTPLHKAVEFGEANVVQVLLEAGAEVNAKDKEGATPLHILATRIWYGAISRDEHHQNIRAIAKLLLDAKADINAKDNKAATPLHKTITWGSREDMAEILLTAGADVNAKDNNGKTPLALTERYNKKMISLLVKYDGER